MLTSRLKINHVYIYIYIWLIWTLELIYMGEGGSPRGRKSAVLFDE
jgi:uncharacterized membrane protein